MTTIPIKQLLVIVSTALVLAFSCETEDPGILEGHVTIGPLVPVVRDGDPEPTPGPEVYAARQIIVFDDDGQTEIVVVQIDSEGNYRVSLSPGAYVVDINHTGIDSAAGLPKTVVIVSGETIRLDVDIDTGIR